MYVSVWKSTVCTKYVIQESINLATVNHEFQVKFEVYNVIISNITNWLPAENIHLKHNVWVS